MAPIPPKRSSRPGGPQLLKPRGRQLRSVCVLFKFPDRLPEPSDFVPVNGQKCIIVRHGTATAHERTGLRVSVLGFGGSEIGYEGASQATVDRLLGSALDAGLNVIDTAECYIDSGS